METNNNINEMGKFNAFKAMLSSVSRNLCISITNFINNNERDCKYYTREDIYNYAEPNFRRLQKKHPALPDTILDKCIDFIIEQMKKRGKTFCLKENVIKINDGQLKHLVYECVKRILKKESD